MLNLIKGSVQDSLEAVDENGNCCDQVDMAPYRWRKQTTKPDIPLTKKEIKPGKKFSLIQICKFENEI
jgi:hypothetical protein